MEQPYFVVIGAAKSGTTSLHRYLSQHPEIFLPDYGEPSFFAHASDRPPSFNGPGDGDWAFITDVDSYMQLYSDAGHQVCGDISPRYLFFEGTALRIRRCIPQARLVAILRHPVDRAYSHFLMNRSRGCEPESDFAKALTLENERNLKGWGWDWCYVSSGQYHRQLLPYVEHFPENQLAVFLYEDLAKPEVFYPELFRFIGVDPAFIPDTSERQRVASVPRSYSVQRLLRHDGAALSLARRIVPASMHGRLKAGLTAFNHSAPPQLDQASRVQFTNKYFAKDIRMLQELTGRDLSSWS